MIRVRARGVWKAFTSRGGHRVDVLQGLDLDLPAGAFLFVTGPSGSGKSTLLHVLSGLMRPDRGEVWWGDHRVSHLPEARATRLRRRLAGFAFQDDRYLDRFRVWENVSALLVALGLPRRERRSRALEQLERLGIADRADHLPWELSGGQRQRAALARALIHRPAVVFADEPAAQVDPETGAAIERVLREENARGTTVVVASHEASWRRPGDRVIRLDGAPARPRSVPPSPAPGPPGEGDRGRGNRRQPGLSSGTAEAVIPSENEPPAAGDATDEAA